MMQWRQEITILSLKHGTTERVVSENAIKLTKSLSLSVSSMAFTVFMANSNDLPDIEPDASSKIIWSRTNGKWKNKETKREWVCAWFTWINQKAYNVLGWRSGLDEPIFYPKIVDWVVVGGASMRPLCTRKSAQKSCAGTKVLPRQCGITF